MKKGWGCLPATLGFFVVLLFFSLPNLFDPSTRASRFKMWNRFENGTTDSKRPSCLSNNVELCTNKKLSMNLFISTNAGHVIFDDMLNLLLYQPDHICNVKSYLIFNGLLDYSPRFTSRKCEENFLYYGFYQTQTLRQDQVRDRVRLVRYTEPQMNHLGTHIRQKVEASCPAKGALGRAVMIRRREEYGRSIPDESIPEGVVSIYADMKKDSLLDILCKISQYDVIIVPNGSETAFPAVLRKRCIILINKWGTDTFYSEGLSQFMVTHAYLYMHSVPNVAKPHHPYYDQFTPTWEEIKALENLVDAGELSSSYQNFTFRPKGTSGEGGFLQLVVDTRTRYVASFLPGR